MSKKKKKLHFVNQQRVAVYYADGTVAVYYFECVGEK